MALVSTETKGHRRSAGDANRRAMEQKRSVRRAKGEHSAEGLKSANRAQKGERR